MKRILTPDLKVFYTDDADALGDIKTQATHVVRYFTRRLLFQELIKAWNTSHTLSGTAVLFAHGTSTHNVWCFGNEKEAPIFRIQDAFINRLDGTVGTIILHVCNPDNLAIYAEKSIVIHPASTFTPLDLIQGKLHPRIYIPNIGYVDDSRKLRSIIGKL